MKKLIVLSSVIAVASTSMANPFGVDVSGNQGTINWTSAHASGVVFAYAKATEGNYFQDGNYNANMTNGKNAGVYMGAYHFERADLNTAATEAAYFWNFAKGKIAKGGFNIMPAIDFETFNGHVGSSTYTAWANSWSSAVVSDAAAKGVTVHPVIAVSPCAACSFTTSITPYPWILSPGTSSPWSNCSSCEEWGPGVWDLWLNGSGSISGISGTVDFDTFNGNLTAMLALLQTK